MSLIIDALKKAQQLRLKDDKGVPFFKSVRPSNEQRQRDSGKRRVLSISGLIGLFLILLMVLWNPFLSIRGEKPTLSAALPGKEKPCVIADSPSQETETTKLDTDSTGVNLSPFRPEGQGLPSTRAQAEGKEVHSESRVLTPPSKMELRVAERVKKGEPLLNQVKEQEKPKISKQSDKAARESLPVTGEVSSQPLETPPPSNQEAAPHLPKETQEAIKPLPTVKEVLTLFNQGVLYQNQREIAKAIQTYQRVIELDPAYSEAHNNLGLLYQEVGDFERALLAYQKAVEINPNYYKALNNLGIFFYLKDRYEEALASFQKAIAVQPNNIESYLNLGILFKKQGQWDKAMESLQKALAINPISGETHYNMALLYEEMNQIELAIDHYQKFMRLSSGTYPALASKVRKHLENLSKRSQEKKR